MRVLRPCEPMRLSSDKPGLWLEFTTEGPFRCSGCVIATSSLEVVLTWALHKNATVAPFSSRSGKKCRRFSVLLRGSFALESALGGRLAGEHYGLLQRWPVSRPRQTSQQHPRKTAKCCPRMRTPRGFAAQRKHELFDVLLSRNSRLVYQRHPFPPARAHDSLATCSVGRHCLCFGPFEIFSVA